MKKKNKKNKNQHSGVWIVLIYCNKSTTCSHIGYGINTSERKRKELWKHSRHKISDQQNFSENLQCLARDRKKRTCNSLLLNHPVILHVKSPFSPEKNKREGRKVHDEENNYLYHIVVKHHFSSHRCSVVVNIYESACSLDLGPGTCRGRRRKHIFT